MLQYPPKPSRPLGRKEVVLGDRLFLINGSSITDCTVWATAARFNQSEVIVTNVHLLTPTRNWFHGRTVQHLKIVRVVSAGHLALSSLDVVDGFLIVDNQVSQ